MSEKINTDHFSTMEELLEHLKKWERDDDIDAYYRFFSPSCAFELVNKIERQQKEIEEKNIAINKMSKDISRQLEEIEKLNFENHMLKKWNKQLDQNCISKDKIKEKIEHYNNELEHIKNGEEFENEKPMYYWGKVALETLLEEN